MANRMGLYDRFWSKVIKRGEDECWEWVAAKNSRGYGVIQICYKSMYAHRIAYELETGEIPDGLCVCHSCDNRSCCNPKHLFLGTGYDNAVDMLLKGRQAKTKLTIDQIKTIRSDKRSNKELGELYGINRSQVSRIKSGSSWWYLN